MFGAMSHPETSWPAHSMTMDMLNTIEVSVRTHANCASRGPTKTDQL